MTLSSIAQYACFLLIILVLVKPVGGYLARVFAGERTILDPALRPVERFIYALCNGTTAIAMLLGRFALAIPALALADLFARQTRRPMTGGKLQTDTLLFASVIVGTAVIVVALTYLPVLALGPVIEHLRLVSGG
jgi:K+-transporting ATPase A subunit